MALSTKSGVLTCPGSTGNQAITGVGFQPKVVLFWCNERAAGGGGDAVIMFGAAVSSSARWVHCMRDHDNVTLTDGVVGFSNSKCISTPNFNDTTVKLDADFVSLDADGFTINWTTVSSGIPVHWVALGGSDITNVALGSVNSGTTNSAGVSVAGLGFQPNLLFLLASRLSTTAAYNNGSTNISVSIGVAAAGSTAGIASYNTDDAATDQDSYQYVANDGTIYWNMAEATGAPQGNNAAFTSFNAGGFTITTGPSGTIANATLGYLAIRTTGGVKVGAAGQKTSTGTQATTGVGFRPSALLLFGTGCTSLAPAAGAGRVGLTGFMGFANATEELAVAFSSTDAAAISESKSSSTQTKAARYVTGATPTVVSEADLSTFDSDGFTLDWTTADATARQFIYLALSPSGFTLAADVGAFTLSGQAAGTLFGRAVGAVAGSFSLAGQVATLSKGFGLVADVGGFSFGGQAAGLLAAHLVGAAAGALSFTGQAAALHRGVSLSVDAGVFVLQGQDATLITGSIPVFNLAAEAGAFAVVGLPVALIAPWRRDPGASGPTTWTRQPESAGSWTSDPGTTAPPAWSRQ
jgi:hypothetical protein